MIEIVGQYNRAICYTGELESAAEAQIKAVCDQSAFADCKIRIMPDVHAGMGCTIGTTMTITDKIVPGMVGVDIGCGMETVELADTEIDFQKLDTLIHHYIPCGRNIRNSECCDDAHEYIVAAAVILHLIDMADPFAPFRALHLGAGIERSADIQTKFLETIVIQQRLAQLSGADEYCVGSIVIAQKLLNIVDQRFPEVANLGAASVGNHSKVLANLNLTHTQGIRQSGSGNMGCTALGQALQIAQVSRQTLKHCLGNFFLFHKVCLLS
jgi:hypothetical protein